MGTAVVTLFALTGACEDPDPCPASNPATVVDSTGVEFRIDGSCYARPTENTPDLYDCASGRVGYMLVWARFVSIQMGCLIGGGIASGAEAERPLGCERDADCPTLYGDVYECVSGLCQHTDEQEFPRDEIDVLDVALMCYGPVDRTLTLDPNTAAAMQVREAIQTACPDQACMLPLPDSCLQP